VASEHGGILAGSLSCRAPDVAGGHVRTPNPALTAALCTLAASLITACSSVPERRTVRFATFNTSLHRAAAGELIADLENGDADARKIAAIVQAVRPDVLLLCEFDHDPEGRALALFCERYLAVGQQGREPIDYAHRFTGEVNTGVPSGFDLDGDGKVGGPGDARGFGRHPGEYGMAVLSRLPIDGEGVRTFRTLAWSRVPSTRMPAGFYSAATAAMLPLSSKSHWDVPIEVGAGRTVHFLVCHPTPPVFDGPEDRNGRRNADEIRLWAHYVVPECAGWIVDDRGVLGGLPAGAPFVIGGDLNADPHDGDAAPAIAQLLENPRVLRAPAPRSAGGAEAARRQGGVNASHGGDPAADTSDFDDQRGPGNLRLDYLLPSVGLEVAGSAVWWPAEIDPDYGATSASDHRLVWIDLRCPLR
jgi:endonuclease/exonuclease/phosphatase family metal-dependent hydrolase